jgi:hypothetical protein
VPSGNIQRCKRPSSWKLWQLQCGQVLSRWAGDRLRGWHVQPCGERRGHIGVSSLPYRQILRCRHGDACQLPGWYLPRHYWGHSRVCWLAEMHRLPCGRILPFKLARTAAVPCWKVSCHNQGHCPRRLRSLRGGQVLHRRDCDAGSLRARNFIGVDECHIPICLPAVPSWHALSRCGNGRSHRLCSGHVPRRTGRQRDALHQLPGGLVLSSCVASPHQVPSGNIQRCKRPSSWKLWQLQCGQVLSRWAGDRLRGWHVQPCGERRGHIGVSSLPCRQILRCRHGDACQLPGWYLSHLQRGWFIV